MLTVLAAIMICAAACTQEKVPPPSASSNTDVIRDSPPYLCTFVPEYALRLASGVTGPLTERAGGTKTDGECRTPDADPNPLSVAWSQELGGRTEKDLDYILNDKQKVFGRHGGIALPVDLGEGMAVHLPYGLFTGQPYEVVAKFPCGGKKRLLSLSFAQFAKGRDAIKDMTELMRIAQKRYGALHHCTPGT
ncbi:hypothetical protein HTZ77_40145 [Nonomuraea sp. SMC257]|uniref:DUF3558 domain-containing protein n=1 Tax=Nonomuraea montanisoli TaxID=2741721 RepID=A0A7Y6IG75_9ACTN|nr:hypothetical protein [Nonomuraea montanisoli]NUW37571.1 hypothetical protein [Nonomuraea montanisoli]